MGYDTLEEAVQSQWDTPIEVVNQDDEKQLVYYLDHSQHVIGTYEYRDEKYFYDGEQSEGMRFSSENGIPYYIRYKNFEGAGDIIYGAISSKNHKVEKFVILYENGEVQEIKAKNNTFISEIPSNLVSNNFMIKIDVVFAYDKNGEVIVRMEY